MTRTKTTIMRELVVLILLCAAEASVFGRFQTATIFGNILGQSKEEQQQPQPPPHHHQLQLQRPPFPPPPPRPPYTSNSLEDQQQQRPPPPPPPPHLQRGDQEAHHLYHQLQESLAQQHALALQTQNLTALVVDLEAREELHVRQLDVLTETVMQVEALLAHERNALQEAKANYSQATQLVAQLQADVETLTQKCNEYEQQADADQAKIVQLKQALKEAKHEAEDLAALIERHRIDRQQEQEQFKRRQKPKRGFWAWLFGRAKDDAYVDDDSLEAAYEQARTSLLKALQTERQNVDELESIVANLQQNNSAISEQLTSQDLIIEELNDRISVFEEDKVVLKAALKQLQVELNQEAPKTQALKTDLKRANERVTKLQAQLNETRVAHDKQVKDLEHKIAAKEIAFQQADANLTMIGTYVDRLEGRLADFALARKTIDQREAAVSELEAQVEAAKQERDAVRKQVSELETELQELKALLKEMAEERRTLKSDIDSLQSERDALSVGQEKLRQSLAQLENDYASLQQAHTELQQSLQGNETSRTAQYENELADSESRVQELSSQLQNAVWERRDLTERLSDTEEVNLQLRERIVELEEAKRKLTEEYQSQLEEARKAVETKSPPHARPAEISVHLTDLGMTVFDFGGKIDAAPPVMTRAQQTGSVQRPPGAKAQSRSVEKRKSPMRSFRKYFAKTTGLHGFFSKNQKMDPNTSVPAHILQSGQGIGQKPTNPRVQPPSTGDSNRAGMPPRQSQQASPQETRMTSQQRTPQGAAPPSSGDDNDNNRRQPLFPGSMDAHAQLAQSQSPSRSFGSDAPSTARP